MDPGVKGGIIVAKIGYCEKCGEYGAIELHHIVHKSKSMVLKDCNINHIYLCGYCHRDNKQGVHGNIKEDKKLKMRLQEQLKELFEEEFVTLDKVKEKLELKDKDIYTLYRSLYMEGDKVNTEELIRVLMGGKLILGQAV